MPKYEKWGSVNSPWATGFTEISRKLKTFSKVLAERNDSESIAASGDNRLYWGIQLDQDLLNTIVGIYPEWFKDCKMNLAVPNDGAESETKPTIIPLAPDPAKTEAEDSSAQKSVDRSKESLRSPPAFHEQRHKMERAKMGDLLKNKLQKRPDRQALVQQHILEDTNADPIIQEKQKQLKKAHMADVLNNQISHRPGPLELVRGNVLQTDELLAQAVKEGSISFRNTCEASSPVTRISQEDDSCSDGTSPSPSYNFSEHSQGSVPSLEASEPSPVPNNNHGSPCSARTSFSMSPPSSVSSPLSVIPSVVSPQSQSDQVPDLVLNGLLLHTKETPSKNRKKAKPKAQPKARTIKFHEYKGPPNAQKNSQSSSNNTVSTETSYDLLLQQQQLFLQWQLEWQQKYPQSVLPPTTQMPNGDQSAQTNHQTVTVSSQATSFESPASPQKVITKLEDLKVSDLKAELKKRNLPVSGPKPVLIERLKSYAESSQNKTVNSVTVSVSDKLTTVTASTAVSVSIGDVLLDSLPTIPVQSGVEVQPAEMNGVSGADISSDSVMGLLNDLENGNQQVATALQQASVISMDVDTVEATASLCSDVTESSSTVFSNEDIVQLQQQCIEKLQRELEKSQLQLQQTMIEQHQSVCETSAGMETELSVSVPCPQVAAISSPPSPVPISSSATSETAATATPSQPVSETVAAQSADENHKMRQRQFIYQQLQQKIHQQSQQAQQQKLKKLQQQHQQQAKGNENTSVSSASIANSALTALLETQPVQPPANISLGCVSKTVSSTSVALASSSASPYLSTMMSEKVEKSSSAQKPFAGVATERADEQPFPGVTPIFISPSAPTPASSASGSKAAKSVSSGTVAHRTSSLPSFSALVNNKSLPARSNTDSHFLVTRPPPNYNEATRQMNKIKQQFLQAHDFSSISRQAKKHKSSIKCQDVDDVLEILIKNGELPPSAAQEPQTPMTPKSELSSPPSYQNQVVSSPPPSSGINGAILTNVATSSVFSTVTPVSSSCESDQDSINAHMSSLQSVLDMTPPSSAGFGEPNKSTTPPALDFDFQLDMEGIEVMDFGGLGASDQNSASSHVEPVLSDATSKQMSRNSSHLESNHMTSVTTNNLLSSSSIDYQSRSMDTDIMEWLELLGENSGTPPINSSSSSYHNPSYSIANDHDPMFSSIGNTQDSLDLFSVDDMDFKASDPGVLSWEKVDFAT